MLWLVDECAGLLLANNVSPPCLSRFCSFFKPIFLHIYSSVFFIHHGSEIVEDESFPYVFHAFSIFSPAFPTDFPHFRPSCSSRFSPGPMDGLEEAVSQWYLGRYPWRWAVGLPSDPTKASAGLALGIAKERRRMGCWNRPS